MVLSNLEATVNIIDELSPTLRRLHNICNGPYCDNCGDCVVCFEEDECMKSSDGKHFVDLSGV